MMEIKGVQVRPLAWQQPVPFRNSFELRWNDRVLAALEWDDASGSTARVSSMEGDWTFRQSGFLNPRVTVFAPGTSLEIAVFQPNWRGEGILETDDGSTFFWVRDEPSSDARWSFRDDRHRQVISFMLDDRVENILKQEAFVEVNPVASGTPGIALLAALGWYVILLVSGERSGEMPVPRARNKVVA